MDIDNLTIREAKELARMFGGSTAEASPASPLIGHKVIVRAYRAGFMYGTLVSVAGETVTLWD